MSDKKGGISAFLEKQKKKGKGKGAAQKQAEPVADAGPTAPEEAKDQTAKDAEVIQTQEPSAAKTNKNQESSEDEDEDHLTYGVIKETKVTDSSK